jgi:hypothetical protein
MAGLGMRGFPNRMQEIKDGEQARAEAADMAAQAEQAEAAEFDQYAAENPAEPSPMPQVFNPPQEEFDARMAESMPKQKSRTKYGKEPITKDTNNEFGDTKGKSKSWKEMIRTMQAFKGVGQESQKDLADKLRKQLDQAEKEPDKVDFRAFGMLADAWTGSKMHGAMTDTKGDKAKKIKNLQGRLQQAIGNLTNNETAELRTKLNSAFQMANMESQEKRAGVVAKAKVDAANIAAKGTSAKNKFFDRLDAETGRNFGNLTQDTIFTDKKMGQLQQVIDELHGGKGATTGQYWKKSDILRGIFAKDADAMKSKVDKIIQEDMKKILGGQFAQKEGEGILRRSFDMNLPSDVNARRLQDLVDMVSEANDLQKMMLTSMAQNGGSSREFFASDQYNDFKARQKSTLAAMKKENEKYGLSKKDVKLDDEMSRGHAILRRKKEAAARGE